ncbi:hypothetical protein [Paraburkholderia gardini]|uniref:Uncharacterized protein n=1 Tax=Paraburkholderia gardini TaxID=2823469 RepID=A0ABM8U9V3_9BURK|nr:hypothetical protein [Paraburkholderia gardini]CAG4920314.1 hypothetical protein R54767_04701 [Paraburkholderia gardini]
MSPEQAKFFREQQEFKAIRDKASRVFQANGKIMPFHGEETPNEYRVKLLNALSGLPYSIGFAGDPAELTRQESKVMSRALEAAHRSPTLNEVVYVDQSGRPVSEFYGQKRSWMDQFKDAPRLMVAVNEEPFRL